MDNCSGIAVFQNNTTTLTTFTVFEESNRSLGPPWHAVFVVAYTIVFLVAISLNILMVLTACRKIRGALWYGGIGSCANFVKFSMAPNGLFGISTLNLISGGPYGTINFYVMLHLGPI